MSRPAIQVTTLSTPIGPITVSAGVEGLVGVDFDVSNEEIARRLARRIGPCEITWQMHPAAAALMRYFGGALMAIQVLPVAQVFGTPFQRQVWGALRRIPVGQTISYGQLAQMVGRPTAVRAVAGANGDNPVAIVVPCHRVIGADGTLVGYGGGIERKKWLLRHEGALLV
jgi:methylated-DNA-[protein]-cysteine S-methyltransferase